MNEEPTTNLVIMCLAAMTVAESAAMVATAISHQCIGQTGVSMQQDPCSILHEGSSYHELVQRLREIGALPKP